MICVYGCVCICSCCALYGVGVCVTQCVTVRADGSTSWCVWTALCVF